MYRLLFLSNFQNKFKTFYRFYIVLKWTLAGLSRRSFWGKVVVDVKVGMQAKMWSSLNVILAEFLYQTYWRRDRGLHMDISFNEIWYRLSDSRVTYLNILIIQYTYR